MIEISLDYAFARFARKKGDVFRFRALLEIETPFLLNARAKRALLNR
jgi:hypothetical protein